jgi:transcriptional regulator with XRE-family HTH domain
MPKTIGSYAYKAICGILHRQRLAAGLSQLDVATKLQQPQSFVAKVEKGQRRLDIIEFVLYCDAIGFLVERALPMATEYARRYPRASSRGDVDPRVWTSTRIPKLGKNSSIR